MNQEPAVKILVVDDEEVIRELIFRLLEREGRLIHRAGSGPEALELIARKSYDILVVDKNMPEVSGLEVIRAARQKNARIKTILVTAYASDDLGEKMKEYGIDECVTKPFNVATFEATVQRLIVALQKE